jgi:hypothetical protein
VAQNGIRPPATGDRPHPTGRPVRSRAGHRASRYRPRDRPAPGRHGDVPGENTHRGIAVFDRAAKVPESPTQLALVGELRQALTLGELRMYVQPKADAISGDVVGVEALVRWQHPAARTRHADEFIPIADDIAALVPGAQYVVALTGHYVHLERLDLVIEAIRHVVTLGRSA